MADSNINHPKCYNMGNIEVIDAIESWKLNFNLGNVIKYTAQCEHKNNKLEDLKKAAWYINREIKIIEEGNERKAENS